MSRRKVIAVAVVAFVLFLIAYVTQEGWVLMPNRAHWWWWGIAGAMFGINIGYQFSEWESRKVWAEHKCDDTIKELTHENREMFLALRQVLIDTVKVEHDKRIVELEHMKAEAEREKLMRLLPLLVTGIAESCVLQDAEDIALVKELAEVCDISTIEKLRDILATKSHELAALLVSVFEKKQKKTEKS